MGLNIKYNEYNIKNKYSKIQKYLFKKGLLNIGTIIAVSVNTSLEGHIEEISPLLFNQICEYVWTTWMKFSSISTDIIKISDIVCDLALDCGIGYKEIAIARYKDIKNYKGKLTKKDLKTLNKIDMVKDLYLATENV